MIYKIQQLKKNFKRQNNYVTIYQWAGFLMIARSVQAFYIILTVPYVIFRKLERHGCGGRYFWLEGPPPAFYILLGAVGFLDQYFKVRFGNISHSLGCDMNLVTYKFPQKTIGSEDVGHGIPVT
jgi:hypothetical protein